MLKRAFFAAAIVTMLNAAALTGVATWAATRGYLSRDRVHAALAALQGESPAATTQPSAATQTGSDIPVPATAEQLRQRETAEEIARTELERRSQEIANAWKLLEMQQLAVVREKESLEADRKRFAEEVRQQAAAGTDDGLAKELEILGGLKAKDAKELLRLKPDADVVRTLMALDARVGRKIVGECKQPEERLWIGRILDKLHEQNAARAEVLGGSS